MKTFEMSVVATFVLAMPAACAIAGEAVLPDTAAGRMAASYIEAFNSGDDTRMEAWESDYRAKSMLKRRPVEKYVGEYRGRFNDFGALDVQKLVSSENLNCVVTMKGRRNSDLLCVEFELEKEKPHRVERVRFNGPMDPRLARRVEKKLDAKIRETVVSRLADELIRAYIFEDVGREMAELIRTKLGAGEYHDITSGFLFARRLTDDLRAICHDKHLRIIVRIPLAPEYRQPNLADGGVRGRGLNYGFNKVEILPGNIGYIKLSGFSGNPQANEAAAAAMAFVERTDALIFDVTENGGGSAGMIVFLAGYLFDEPVHLNSFENRSEGTNSDTWSAESVPGERYGEDKPVYVLTSHYTFSAAEEFTHDLKHLKRATVVGEASGGGAHPVTGFTINKYFEMMMPFGRAVNPITKTNWEGVGVIPHVEVAVDRALETAHKLALKAVKEPQSTAEVETPGEKPVS